jgi:hypothetical protein
MALACKLVVDTLCWTVLTHAVKTRYMVQVTVGKSDGLCVENIFEHVFDAVSPLEDMQIDVDSMHKYTVYMDVESKEVHISNKATSEYSCGQLVDASDGCF